MQQDTNLGEINNLQILNPYAYYRNNRITDYYPVEIGRKVDTLLSGKSSSFASDYFL